MKRNFECVFVLSRFNFSVLQKYCITTKAIFLFFMQRQHNRRTVIKILKREGECICKIVFYEN